MTAKSAKPLGKPPLNSTALPATTAKPSASDDTAAREATPAVLPVDEHHGLGGDYELVNGVRRLMRRAGTDAA